MKTLKSETITKLDFSYYVMNDRYYKKGRLVHAIIAEIAGGMNYFDLLNLFDNNFNSSYHIIEGTYHARKMSKFKKRYFTNIEDILTSADGIKFCVCNQIGIGNINGIIKIAKANGMDIFKVKMRA